MTKGRLAPYILVSFLIHAGVLVGTHQFLKLPAEELETAELIPVEIVVAREESPVLEALLAPGDRIWPKKNLETKSRKRIETAADRSADDIATPVPKTYGFEPNVTIAGMATTAYIAGAQAGESADSKPIVSAWQILPPQISPVAPSAPTDTALPAVKMPAVLFEANAKLTPADSQLHQKVATPLPTSRPAAEPDFGLPPLAKTSNDEPRSNVAMVPTRGFTPRARKGESVGGKPMNLVSQIFLVQVSPVYPSAPAESSKLEVKIPAVLAETRTELTPANFQTPQKVATPLPGIRPVAGTVLETPSLATKRHDEPRLTLNTNPTVRDVPRSPPAETIAGNPTILAFQMSPRQLSPADPSPPPAPSPLDVGMPAVPIESKAAAILAYSPSSQKIKTPLASRQHREDLPAGLQPNARQGIDEPVLRVSTLQVQSRPNGAQVYVNDSLIGQTPLTWELPLGKHEVRLSLPDYYEWYAQVEITSEHETFPILCRLVPINETK